MADLDIGDCAVDGIPNAVERELLDLAMAAKGVCSGVFVSRRPLTDILARSVAPRTGAGTPIEFSVDTTARRVTAATAAGLARHALHCGDQGAVILPLGSHKVLFEPRRITPSDATDPWSLEPAERSELIAAGYDPARLDRALDDVFEAPGSLSCALAILHRGRLVAERYAAGIGPQTQLQSWSMGKTLVASLIGRLMALGHLDLDQDQLLAEWRTPDDPRGRIRLRDLLQMSSGLDFTALWKEDFRSNRGYPDHAYMYNGAVDVEKLALSRPLAHPPGTFGAYQNADTLALLAIAKRLGSTLGLHPLEMPQRLLLDHLGIRGMVLEADPYGNHVLTGFNFGTARDWIRLGALWLHDGLCNGKTLIAPELIRFARQPAPAWRGKYWMADAPAGFDDAIYGGHVFLNRHHPSDRWPLPADTFYMLGIAGQVTFVVPSLELVLVHLADHRALERGLGREPLQGALPGILAALPGAAPP